jgi:hypothetical protein
MKTSFIFLAIFLFCAVAAFPQNESDLERYGFKGSVKNVQSYEIHFWGAEDSRRQGSRNVSGILNFDRNGNILELMSFNNDGNGSYYEKQVYFHDSSDRKSSLARYISSKSAPDEVFDSAPTKNFYYNLILRLKESLSTRTFYKYDEKGRLIEKSEITAKGEIAERWVFAYNEDGKTTRFAIYDGQNALTTEINTNFKDNGRTAESVRIEKGVEINKSIQYFDEKGRLIKGEQFILKPSANLSGAREIYLHNRTIYKFTGDKTEMEWMFFEENGTPQSKLIITDNNKDDEYLRESYDYRILPDDNSNPKDKSEWRLTGREFRNYEYDKRGNWIKCTWLRQENFEKPPFPTSIYERDISYY